MPRSAKIQTNYVNEAGSIPIKNHELSSDLSQNIDVEIAAGAVDYEIDVSIPSATLIMCGFAVEKSKVVPQVANLQVGNITIKTNNATTPSNTLNLLTTNGVAWSLGDDPVTNPMPITSDVTKLFVSNDGDAVATLKVRSLNDATPT